jgi:hypothetical protein
MAPASRFGMSNSARFMAKVSDGGRSQSSCCFWPMTSVIMRRKSARRSCGTKPPTVALPLVA